MTWVVLIDSPLTPRLFWDTMATMMNQNGYSVMTLHEQGHPSTSSWLNPPPQTILK